VGGGNSHQQNVARTRRERIEKEVLVVVSTILGRTTPPPDKEIPWYESGRFWGGATTAISILIAVVSAALKDIRWLVFLAWPFAVLSWAVICKPLKESRWHWRWSLLLFLAIATAVGVWRLYVWLPRPESSSTKTEKPAPTPVPVPVPVEPQALPVPSFAFSAEIKIVSPGSGDFNGFWIMKTVDGKQGCSIEPIDDVLFLRVTNSGPISTSILNYTIETKGKNGWSPLKKVDMGAGYMLFTLQGDAWPDIGLPLQFSSNGNRTMFPILTWPYGGANIKKAGFVQLQSFDLAANAQNLTPGQAIHGWSSFQHQGLVDGPLRMTIVDELGKTHLIPETIIKPSLNDDLTRHLLMVKDLVDVSMCRQKADF
jgi:hypothetical protein